MKHILVLLLCATIGYAQTTSERKSFNISKKATVNLSNIKDDFHPSLKVREMPKPSSAKMKEVYYPTTTQQKISTPSSTLAPIFLGKSFLGNGFANSTPNDNDIAISDSGMIISTINTSIYVYDTKTSTASPVKSLAAFTSPINNKHLEFDPKVMYDPKSDRFVIVILNGDVDTTSSTIVGFSQTNDPNGNWNLYQLPGDALNNQLWTDYPMIALTENELFLTVNLLYNDSSWQTGFVETIVWQINKEKGYTGQSLSTYLHHNIKFNNKPIRNLCPVKGGSKLYGPNMYFVSNRNLASQNDTVFLVEITDTINSPNTAVIVKLLKTPQLYNFPPDAKQVSAHKFATNDSRTLGAFIENNTIQYVHNTKNIITGLTAVNYGIISNVTSSTPSINTYIVSNDTVDYGYPNISYAGNSTTDNTSIITFNHSSPKIYAGCSAVKADGNGNFSPVLKIKDGTSWVDVLSDALERWGDYSGSQRRYNKPGQVWMSGYYGYKQGFSRLHGAWIAQIGIDNSVVGIEESASTNSKNVIAYPNPTLDMVHIDIDLKEPEYLSFDIYDVAGKHIATIVRDWVKQTKNTFSFSTASLQSGVYTVTIKGNKGTSITKRIVKQ